MMKMHAFVMNLGLVCIAAFMPSKGLSWSSFMPSIRADIATHSHTSNNAQASSRRCTPSMKIKVGLVGLPNVGKSTLFNAIAQKSIADAKNFPFCTIGELSSDKCKDY